MSDEPNWDELEGTLTRVAAHASSFEATDDFLALPYRGRQFVTLMPDEVARAQRSIARDGAAVSDDAFKNALKTLAPAASTALIDLWIRDFQKYKKAREKGLHLLLITDSEAGQLTFPLGHPRDQVLYVGHPAAPLFYVPMAEFHRVLFEHKVAEALHLLVALGATDIEVEHLSGWESAAAIGVGVADVTAKGQKSNEQSRRILARMKLRPHRAPEIPQDLNWYEHEPLWKQVARARLDAGLESFELDITYTDDFGVNANLSAKIKGIGIDVGGSFTRHQETIWRLRGKFGEPPGA